jgi:polyhydroxyalkanoate synthesis regulator phasin
MPFELMKKVMMTGIGLALKSQSEMEALTKDLIKKSKMSEAEGKKFVDDVMKKYDKAKKDMENTIRKGIADYMSSADIASKKEVDSLKQEIKKLKKAPRTKK